MKKRIAKGFHWSLVLVEFGALLLVFLLYILSDPRTLQYAVDRATSGLDVSYESISGNFLKTMTVKNLKYKGELLASEAEIDWNLHALIKADIEIETLSLKNVNLKNIENIINNSEKKSNKTASSSHISIPEISISHLYLSTLPYQNNMIKIDSLEVEIYDISSDLKHIAIKEFSIDTKNDHCNIIANGSLQKQLLHFHKLSLGQIDIAKIQQSINTFSKKEDNQSKPFTLITDIQIDTLDATVRPYDLKPYKLHTLKLHANALQGSLQKLLFNADSIFLQTDTNLGKAVILSSLSANNLQGKSTLNFSDAYLKKFTSLINFKNFNPLHLTFHANQKRIDANLSVKSKQLFSGRYKDYPVAIDALKSKLSYDINHSKLQVLTDASLSTKYAASLQLTDKLVYDQNLSYAGDIKINGLKHFPKFSLPIFDHAIIHYQGNSKDLIANLLTDKLHLLYKMYDFKKADFKLQSKPLELVRYFPQIPAPLSKTTAVLDASMALDFAQSSPIMIESNITSNAVNIKGVTKIEHGVVTGKTKATLSQNSILKQIDKNIKLHNIFPADFDIGYQEQNLTLSLHAPKEQLVNHFSYDFNNSYYVNTLILPEDKLTLQNRENLTLHTHTFSLKTLQEELGRFYTFSKEPYDGEVELNATIQDFKHIKAQVFSRWFVYEYTLNKFAFAEKIHMTLHTENDRYTLDHYKLHSYLDYDRYFYATKPSTVIFKDQKLQLLSFWVNDALRTKGGYNITEKSGVFNSTAKNYHYQGKEGDITFDTDIQTTMAQKRIHVEGDVAIKKGVVTYEHRKTHNIQDPDIIIIQEEEMRKAMAAEKKSDFSIDVSVSSQKPITYKVPQIDVKVTPDIKIWKVPQQNIELLGRVIVNKGTYTQADKEFVIQPGEILFGGDILNPYLNLKAQYSSNPYIIDIIVTGTLDSPIVNFSSNPFLSQSDILSMLLFSTTTDSLFESSGSSSTQAISMLGNTFAKEIVKNFGLSLDKLVLSTNEQGGLGVEIGKKLSKKITVIYINDIVQSIKVKYQNSNRFETDIMFSPESSGIDFLYKSEH